MCFESRVLRCLIVDDSAGFIEAARHLLEHGGMSVVATASTSTDALRLFKELTPDITLVDVHLGAEDGFELVERLHHSGLSTPPPVILMSTHAEQDLADLIASSSAVGFVAKFALTTIAIRRLIARR